MTVVLVILSLAFLGFIIYSAISPKSSQILRLCAIIALGLICVSLLVSGIFLIIGPDKEEDDILLPVFQDMAQPERKESSTNAVDIIVIAIFIFALSLVILKAMRDQKKAELNTKKTPRVSTMAGRENRAKNELDDLNNKDDTLIIDDDDSFDIK